MSITVKMACNNPSFKVSHIIKCSLSERIQLLSHCSALRSKLKRQMHTSVKASTFVHSKTDKEPLVNQ